jgi:hypothetical protein
MSFGRWVLYSSRIEIFNLTLESPTDIGLVYRSWHWALYCRFELVTGIAYRSSKSSYRRERVSKVCEWAHCLQMKLMKQNLVIVGRNSINFKSPRYSTFSERIQSWFPFLPKRLCMPGRNSFPHFLFFLFFSLFCRLGDTISVRLFAVFLRISASAERVRFTFSDVEACWTVGHGNSCTRFRKWVIQCSPLR